MRIIKNLSIIVLSCLLLAGCDKPFDEQDDGFEVKADTVKPTYISPENRINRLHEVRHWRIYGAFEVVPSDQSKRIINFNWYQKGPNLFNIRLNTPAGFYQVALQNYFGTLTFWRTPTRFIRAKSFRNLMLSEVGWYVPFRYFFYWIRGIPVPASLSKGLVVKKYDKYGRLIVLGQNGWVVHFEEYRHYYDFDVPTKISVFGSHVQFRIAIQQWLFYFENNLIDIPKTNEILLKSL